MSERRDFASRLIAKTVIIILITSIFAVSSLGRLPAADQAMLLLATVEFPDLGDLYRDGPGFYPPAFWAFQELSVSIANTTQSNLMMTYYAICTALALFAAALVSWADRGRLSPFPIVGSFAVFTLFVEDHSFGQREYLFAIFWIPYLVLRANDVRRLRSANPSHCPTAPMVAIAVLAGTAGCIKPHFAGVMALTELGLLLITRRIAVAPVMAAVAGLLNVGLLFAFVSVEVINARLSFFVNQYYAVYWFPLDKLVPHVLKDPKDVWALAVTALIIILTVRSSWRHRRSLALLIASTEILGFVLVLLQGFPRAYYYQLIYLPAGILVVLLASDVVDRAPQLRYLLPRSLGPSQTACSDRVAFWSLAFASAAVVVTGLTTLGPFVAQVGSMVEHGRPHTVLARYALDHVPPEDRIMFIGSHGEGGFSTGPSLIVVAAEIGRPTPGRALGLYGLIESALILSDTKLLAETKNGLLTDLKRVNPDWIFLRRDFSGGYLLTLPPSPNFEDTLFADEAFASYMHNFQKVMEFPPYYSIYRRLPSQPLNGSR
jgi:hypothetical protein